MSFKTFDLANDVASIVSSINEVVSVSSSIYANNLNIKFFSNIASGAAGTDLGGYWESVYDSSPTSSLSTALLDLSYGYSTGSSYNIPVTVSSSQNEKIKIYRQFASLLLGNPDSVFTVNNQPQTEAFFISIKRNIQKDELKKGSVSLIFNEPNQNIQVTGSDSGAVTQFMQTYGGDFAPLLWNGTGSQVGQVWYQAGVIVIPDQLGWPDLTTPWSGTVNLNQAEASASINQLVDGFRVNLGLIAFHNQTNLYSTVYFCRAQNTEFNYSSNPTFIDSNQRIVVTSGSNILQTRTYITTVGLYDANDNLLAAAKVNMPITKSPDTEAVFRIRLDY
ncbi:MAG: hypothetical protein ACYDHY_07575 [Acidiferrobacterales bacterium]